MRTRRKARAKRPRKAKAPVYPELTLREFAELVGRAPSTVSAWCEGGMPHAQPGKTNEGFSIRLPEALPWVLTYALEPPKESQRERLAREQADKIALENARRRGELLDAVVVGEILRAIPTTVRGQHDAMDNRCAGEFAAISDPARMRERMRQEHRSIDIAMANVTRELAETCERAARDAAAVDTAPAANGGSMGG